MKRRMSLQAAKMLAKALEERKDLPGLADLLRTSQSRFLESQGWFQFGTSLVAAVDRVKGGAFTYEVPKSSRPSSAIPAADLLAALHRRNS